MNDQYEIDRIGDFAFARTESASRGTQYRCKICKKSLNPIKAVFAELSGGEKTKFRKKLNSLHHRHKKDCEGGGGGEGGGEGGCGGGGDGGGDGSDDRSGGDGGGDGVAPVDQVLCLREQKRFLSRMAQPCRS